MGHHHTERPQDQFFFFEQQQVDVRDFESSGLILDIGGGGEGIIGILKGERVIAIDFRKEELEEAAEGPLKIVMDARELQFLDDTFNTATAFFSLMYIKSRADHAQVFSEAFRVLRPGGQFLIWDVSVPERSDEKKDIYVVPIVVHVASKKVETGYGQRWPKEPHDAAFYVKLADESGFRIVEREESGRTFFLRLQKP
jgi:ubiquinone/menaquinone biosynthesis C-methylase UbiE